MQLAILIFQMTDASGILPVYMHIHVLISAYLFLSGYGHFCYFWQRGEAGIVRFFQVSFQFHNTYMSRMTFIVCVTSYLINCNFFSGSISFKFSYSNPLPCNESTLSVLSLYTSSFLVGLGNIFAISPPTKDLSPVI